MRLSFVTVPPEKIDQGVKVLAELVKEKMAAHNA
jgi:2-aminoadipate transaminase